MIILGYQSVGFHKLYLNPVLQVALSGGVLAPPSVVVLVHDCHGGAAVHRLPPMIKWKTLFLDDAFTTNNMIYFDKAFVARVKQFNQQW